MVVNSNGVQYWQDGVGLCPMPSSLAYVPRKLTPLTVSKCRGGRFCVRFPGRIDNRMEDCTETSYKWLTGRVLPTNCTPTFKDEEGDVAVATNSTVKDGSRGAAYSIHTTKRPGTIRSVMPVNGPPQHLTLYHTELFGIIGALLLLQTLFQADNRQWQQLPAVLWCNNEAAV